MLFWILCLQSFCATLKGASFRHSIVIPHRDIGPDSSLRGRSSARRNSKLPVMYLPPEIILNILDHLDCTSDSQRNDRATLISFRSACKDFYNIATPVLFRDFSLHYGVSRSIAQMRAVAASPVLRSSIRFLFIPSESFFPLGKDVQFNIKDHYPWSRGSVLDWLTSHNYSQATPIRKGVKGRRNHAEQTLMLNHPFREYPTRPWQIFSLRQKEFRDQHQAYSQALSSLLDSCENLEGIHIAIGLGGETLRMVVFGKILGKHLMPRIITKGIRRLKISAPTRNGTTLPFSGYVESSHEAFGKLPQFSSLESFVIQSCYARQTTPPSNEFATLFHTLTGLTSYTFACSSPIKCQLMKGMIGSPLSAASPNLTRVKLASIFLWKDGGHFQNFISDIPTVTELTLDHIILQIDYRSGQSHSSLSETWAAIFRHILSALPKLTTYSFRLLMYGAETPWWGQFPRDAHMFLPGTVDGKVVATITWHKILGRSELVSPYEEDWKGFESFKKTISNRKLREVIHSEGDSGDFTEPAWAASESGWHFIADI